MICVFVGCGAHALRSSSAELSSIVEFDHTVFELTESGQNTLGKTYFVYGRSLKAIKRIEFDVKCACFEPSLERSSFSPGEEVPVYIHVEFGQMQGRVLKNFKCIFYDEQGRSQSVVFEFELNLRKAYIASEEFIMARVPRSGAPTAKIVDIELAKDVAPLLKIDAADPGLVDISWEPTEARKYRISITPHTIVTGNRFTDVFIHTGDGGRFSSIRLPLVITDSN